MRNEQSGLPLVDERRRLLGHRSDDTAESLQPALAAEVAPAVARDETGVVGVLEDRQRRVARLHTEVIGLDDHPRAIIWRIV
ncbi:MAG: hypothetical protein WKF58_06015 [Ilumatobacteraceae bacterium]